MESDFVPSTKVQKLIIAIVILLISGGLFLGLAHYDNEAYAAEDIAKREGSVPSSLISSAPAPEVEIAPAGVPKASFGSWAIVNLFLTIATGLLMFYLLFSFIFIKRTKAPEALPKKCSLLAKEFEKNKSNNQIIFVFISLVTTSASIVLFMATENTKLSIQLFDNHTLLHAIILIATLLVVVLSGKGNTKTNKSVSEEAV